jgi:hypothetical protein
MVLYGLLFRFFNETSAEEVQLVPVVELATTGHGEAGSR